MAATKSRYWQKRSSRLSRGPAADLAHHEYAKSFRSSGMSAEKKVQQTPFQRCLRPGGHVMSCHVATTSRWWSIHVYSSSFLMFGMMFGNFIKLYQSLSSAAEWSPWGGRDFFPSLQEQSGGDDSSSGNPQQFPSGWLRGWRPKKAANSVFSWQLRGPTALLHLGWGAANPLGYLVPFGRRKSEVWAPSWLLNLLIVRWFQARWYGDI